MIEESREMKSIALKSIILDDKQYEYNESI